MAKMVLRNNNEKAVSLWLEQAGNDVDLMAEDTTGEIWSIVRVKEAGTIELFSGVDSPDFVTAGKGGYVKVVKD